jgi:hypothetical protein
MVLGIKNINFFHKKYGIFCSIKMQLSSFAILFLIRNLAILIIILAIFPLWRQGVPRFGKLCQSLANLDKLCQVIG